MALRDGRCRPCRAGDLKLAAADIARLAPEIPSWEVAQGRLVRRLRFATFAAAMAFVNRMAALAEAEGHHPDFAVHYDRVDVSIWTHAIGGLSENDFILAAKLDALNCVDEVE